MGRHRRSAGRAATDRATGVTPGQHSITESHARDPHAGGRPTMGIAPYLNPEAYAEANARSSAYLYATQDGGDRARDWDTAVFAADEFAPAGGSGGASWGGSPGGFPGPSGPDGGRRRKKRVAKPVRTGLLGVSAAVAIGTVAVAAGVVPGLQNYKLGGGASTSGGDRIQAAGSPSNTATEQGGTSGNADSRTGSSSTSRNSDRPASPTPSAAPSTSTSPASSATPTKTPSTGPATTLTPSGKPTSAASTPSRTLPKAPVKTSAPATVSSAAAAEAEVLKLVNEQRAKVGCSALSANSSLTSLAESFSDDMAARGFFDHTDPDGHTPWDRAAKAGITDLGGENIARGQADAAAVMDAWMNSPGHRANILNCDFKTLGVGVHFGSGGPWWTQDFGY
ncbi:CAP domain-containing protein [Streptomyces sp. NPDC006739]|uniref:CAP domain-containing protein n=1 Tax=Streptomyces sp. NPDC006739 TaxID=3364763 RepID=UPI0036CABFBA